MADQLTDLTVPLGDVPVGTHVVYDEEVFRVKPGVGPDSRWLTDGHAETLRDHTDRALPLDGDHPVPLRECIGRDVWIPEFPGGRVGVARWSGADHWWHDENGRIWAKSHTVKVWPIARREPQRWTAEDCQVWQGDDRLLIITAGSPDEAQALAAHLNANPWEPPAPEPERPTWLDIVDAWSVALPSDESHNQPLPDLLAEHGYVVVDVRALADAIEWLRFVIGHGYRDEEVPHARALLDAMGVDDRG